MKTDCFAYRPNKCAALIEMVCEHKECRFYKTWEQYEHDLKKSRKMRDKKFGMVDKYD